MSQQISIRQACGCEKVISAKSQLEAKRLVKWLSQVSCSDCQKQK